MKQHIATIQQIGTALWFAYKEAIAWVVLAIYVWILLFGGNIDVTLSFKFFTS